MRLWIYFGLVVIFSQPVTATELAYRFTDPSFGGNPLNGNFLINQASEQNATKEPVAPEKTELQLFTENFQSSILSGLADAASGNLIGADGNLTPNSSIRVGNFSVSVSDVINGGVSVSISDGISNTVLTVPRINSQ